MIIDDYEKVKGIDLTINPTLHQRNWTYYYQQYITAFSCLLDVSRSCNYQTNFRHMAFLFLMRHSLELLLKNQLEQNQTAPIKSFSMSHNLLQLANLTGEYKTMSRIGNKVINLPAGVEVTNNNNVVTVKGPKGKLTREFNKNIEIKVEGNEVSLHRPNDSKEMKTIHGTTRANLNNMVVGVSEGFKKELEMRGVGYRAQLQGSKLVLSVGKSHQDEVEAPEGISFEVPSATNIVVNGINKEVVGQTAAYIRSLRAPEPYKGKGIRYVGEYVRRKEGKTGK